MKAVAQPRFHKARPVPYALQEAVEAEYNRLESEGIVEKRSNSANGQRPWFTYQKQTAPHGHVATALTYGQPTT